MDIPQIKDGDDARMRLGGATIALASGYVSLGNAKINVLFKPMVELLDSTRKEVESVYSQIRPGTLTNAQKIAVRNALVRTVVTMEEVKKNGFKAPPGWDDFLKIVKERAKEVGAAIGSTVGAAADTVGGTAGGLLGGIFKGMGIWAFVLIAAVALVIYLKLS